MGGGDLENGPGRLNKYRDIKTTRSLVNYRSQHGDAMRMGRPLWQNFNNPYQFDLTYINRVRQAMEHAQTAYETEVTRMRVTRLRSDPSCLSARSDFGPTNKVKHIAKDMPGYTGFIPRYAAENIHARCFANTTLTAETLRNYPEILSTAPLISGARIAPPVPYVKTK